MMGKLMRVCAACKLRLAAVALAAALASGCPAPPQRPPAAAPAAPPPPAPYIGVPYDIVTDQSLLTVLAYRGGALASAGHNHVIASHALSGTIYVPEDILRTSFEVHVPVAALTVDEPAMRAREDPAAFPPEVPASAREGTRRNMLGDALLDATHYPEITLRALSLALPAPPALAGAAGGTVLARVEATVRGTAHTLTAPVRYRLEGGRLELSADTPLRQSDLGLTPFSALLGALVVQDEMRVRLQIVARAAMR